MRFVIGFGISSLCILIPAVIYTFCETVAHLSRTAGTMTYDELWMYTSKIDKLCVLFEIINLFGDIIFAFYLILVHGDASNVTLAGYGCFVLVFIGFVLLLIKYFLSIKLYNIFTEWNRQKTLLIKQNSDILMPSREDIVELHGLLSDIKSHELDVAMFDLFGIALHNIPIIAIIIILTLFEVLEFDKKWNVDILPLFSLLLSILVISWKFMKLIVVKSGCNDSSDVPSKFASLTTYRPSSTTVNDEKKEIALKVKVTKRRVLNLDEEGDTPKDDEGGDKDMKAEESETVALNMIKFDTNASVSNIRSIDSFDHM